MRVAWALCPLHVWEAQVKVAEAKKTALLPAGSASLVHDSPVVAVGPQRPAWGPPPPDQRVPQTTVLIRLTGLDLELPPVPVPLPWAAAP